MVHAYGHGSWALQNRLIGEELGDRAKKETATFGNGIV